MFSFQSDKSISLEDLKNYRAIKRNVLHGNYNGKFEYTLDSGKINDHLFPIFMQHSFMIGLYFIIIFIQCMYNYLYEY